ncbi:hypothetical protein BCV69DRAFT_253172, partial [Microstroma glucosiphilum]
MRRRCGGAFPLTTFLLLANCLACHLPSAICFLSSSTHDALLVFECVRRGIMPKVNRRLRDDERRLIRSGAVFVFDERESGIKRWTDGLLWSPSRILWNFLVYRQIEKKAGKGATTSSVTDDSSPLSRGAHRSPSGGANRESEIERALVGSLKSSYPFAKDGLCKKTISIQVHGSTQHLISYYKVEDVRSGRLRTPLSLPEISGLDISPMILQKSNFRNPPDIEVLPDGTLRYRGDGSE